MAGLEAGAERTHGAMLPHAGPDSRIFREVCDLGRELGVLADVLGAAVAAEVAILLDWDSWRGVELDHQPHSGFRWGCGSRSTGRRRTTNR
jgi:beta-galactosidase